VHYSNEDSLFLAVDRIYQLSISCLIRFEKTDSWEVNLTGRWQFLTQKVWVILGHFYKSEIYIFIYLFILRLKIRLASYFKQINKFKALRPLE